MAVSGKSLIQFVVLLAFGILLIWLSWVQVAPEKENIISAFKQANYFWAGISLLIALFSHFLRAYRWNYLLIPAGYRVNLFNSFCAVIVGYFANYGIPRMGELTRCTLAARYDKVPFEVALGTVITERIVDTLVFLLIFVLALVVQFSELSGLADKLLFSKVSASLSGIGSSPVKIIILLGVTAAVVAGLFFLRKKFSSLMKNKFGKILKGVGSGISSVAKTNKPVQFVFLSLLIWASYFYCLYFCLFAISGTAHLGQKECLTLLLFGTLGVIFAPGGLGAYPAIVGGILLYTYKVDTASAFALPWLSWTAQFVLLVVLGLFCLFILPVYNKKRNAIPQTA
jgi:uncharacterized protein (TIRG00374 family)